MTVPRQTFDPLIYSDEASPQIMRTCDIQLFAARGLVRPSTGRWEVLLDPSDDPPGTWRSRFAGLAIVAIAAGLPFLGLSRLTLVVDDVNDLSQSSCSSRGEENWDTMTMHVEQYYWLLFPLSIPTAIVAAYVNWLSLEFYKNN